MMEICYLKRSRSRNPSRKQFILLDYTVYFSPDEILELLVDFNGDLSMGNDVIQSMSTRLSKRDPSNLNVSKLFLIFYFLLVFFSVSVFRSTNRYFWKNYVFANSFLNRWLNLVYFKLRASYKQDFYLSNAILKLTKNHVNAK